jgi:hypothetical protein
MICPLAIWLRGTTLETRHARTPEPSILTGQLERQHRGKAASERKPHAGIPAQVTATAELNCTRSSAAQRRIESLDELFAQRDDPGLLSD